MARYRITYEIGHSETVTAADVMKDIDEGQYRFTNTNGLDVALIPADNVLSIVREDDGQASKTATVYPHQDGDVLVLGPEVFASADGEAISWRGENYTRNPRNLFGKVTG